MGTSVPKREKALNARPGSKQFSVLSIFAARSPQNYIKPKYTHALICTFSCFGW